MLFVLNSLKVQFKNRVIFTLSKIAFLLLATGIAPFASSSPKTSQRIWSIVRYQNQTESYVSAAQLQYRYRFDQEKLYEEQVNLSVGRITSLGVWTAILTLRTLNGYEKFNELRGAVQWERGFALSSRHEYSLRFRHEFQQFSDQSQLAHRFRVLNEVARELGDRRKIVLNQEVNVYVAETRVVDSGFASLRTILALEFPYEKSRLSVGYLNDYREDRNPIETRHVLLLSLAI